jgi:hypothetical protein
VAALAVEESCGWANKSMGRWWRVPLLDHMHGKLTGLVPML